MNRFVLAFTAVLCFAATEAQQQAALERISAADLRADLSFLSSDALEGRDTPSRGLDVAAEFIASRFRRAGLEPVGGSDYFQVAKYFLVSPDLTGFTGSLDDDKNMVPLKSVSARNLAPLDLQGAPVYKVETREIPSLEGKVAVMEMPEGRGEEARSKIVAFQELLKLSREHHAAAVLIYGPSVARLAANQSPRLVEANAASEAPILYIAEAEPSKLLESLKAGETKATLTIHLNGSRKTPVDLRNVAGLLRGSDPELSKTFILVTAHYDHIGIKPAGEGDRIFNGANDDGSGTVSVIEIANALAAAPHPKRSILFMTFFGEEKGLFGSHYYASHPLFPLKQTIAQINLEQLGRTDDTDGPQVGTATFTGFDFSDLPATFKAAGKAVGVKVYDSGKNGDAFFARSDNQSLADAGIPAHTLAVTFEFPDYHGVGDEWEKIDYNNMAKVDRMIALGLLSTADNTVPPQWNEKNHKTRKYAEAYRKLLP